MADGHGGLGAAFFVKQNITSILHSKLTLLDSLKDMEAIHKALCETFALLEASWLASSHTDSSGSTLTLLLLTPLGASETLVTLANVGDSEAVLDTGISLLELSLSHNLDHNRNEVKRLRAHLDPKYRVAQLSMSLDGPAMGEGRTGVGPLRAWVGDGEGGLCMGRSIGDSDGGAGILPLPNIKQVVLPADRPARIILASDGLWDTFTFSSACLHCRSLPAPSAASSLVENPARFFDDTSVIIVDLLPRSISSFNTWAFSPAVKAAALDDLLHPTTPKNGGLCACFVPDFPEEPNSLMFKPSSVGYLALAACVDTYAAFPNILVSSPEPGTGISPVSQLELIETSSSKLISDHSEIDEAFDALRSSLVDPPPPPPPTLVDTSSSANELNGKQGWEGEGGTWILTSDDFKARRSMQRGSQEMRSIDFKPTGVDKPVRSSMHAASPQYMQPMKKGTVRASIDLVRHVLVAPVKMLIGRTDSNLSISSSRPLEDMSEEKKREFEANRRLRQSVEISRGGRNSFALPPKQFLRGSIDTSNSPYSPEVKLNALHAAKFTKASFMHVLGSEAGRGSNAPPSVSKALGGGQALHDIMESGEYEEDGGSESKRNLLKAPTAANSNWQNSKLY